MNRKLYITRLSRILPIILLLMGGCSSQVQVKGHFPTPIVNQLPYTLGVYYPDTFIQYSYVEQNKDRAKRTIGIGAAQVSLFSSILPSMFNEVVTLEDVSDIPTSSSVDLVLAVNVDDFQYTMPNETKVDMYEVWIKYNLRLFDTQGQLIADWILTAYGKTPSAILKSDATAINEAMIVALRDAGAGFTLSFSNVPEIRSWLEQQSSRPI